MNLFSKMERAVKCVNVSVENVIILFNFLLMLKKKSKNSAVKKFYIFIYYLKMI